ncbi:MAG TPA: MFS transporter [Solirubrobacterales bacterium]|nr:MFS transporter [Solirubrobacterales bacterium]
METSIEPTNDPVARSTPTRDLGIRGWLGVYALALGCFCFVSTELSPVGLLPQIAGGLGTSDGTAGLLVSGFAIVVALTVAPLTILAGGMSRRSLITLLLGACLAGNLLASVASSYPILLLARIIVALAIGAFWSTAAGTAVRLVPERDSVRATSIVMGGLSLAAVLGVPMATWLGRHAGWHAAFAGLAVVSLVAMLTTFALLPHLAPTGGRRGTASLRRALESAPIRSAIMVTGLVMTGTFLLFTFITPFLTEVTGLGGGIAILLVVYGGAGVLGTLGIAPIIRHGFERALTGVLLLMAASLFGLWLVGSLPAPTVALLVFWGAAYGALPVLLQTWVFRETARSGIDAEAATSLYVGAYNAAIAIGSFAGALIVDAVGPRPIAVVGAACATAALVCAVVGLGRGRERSPAGEPVGL